ncbi:hypothetical protein GN956_G22399 [Arapaima gigas]
MLEKNEQNIGGGDFLLYRHLLTLVFQQQSCRTARNTSKMAPEAQFRSSDFGRKLSTEMWTSTTDRPYTGHGTSRGATCT